MTQDEKNLILSKLNAAKVEAIDDGDPEIGHITADMALCEALTLLGYEEIVKLYKSIPKWYA